MITEHLITYTMNNYRPGPGMPGGEGEWCDPRHPCHGPFDPCPLDSGRRAAFFTTPSSPPAPAFKNQAEPEPDCNPMDKYRQA